MCILDILGMSFGTFVALWLPLCLAADGVLWFLDRQQARSGASVSAERKKNSESSLKKVAFKKNVDTGIRPTLVSEKKEEEKEEEIKREKKETAEVEKKDDSGTEAEEKATQNTDATDDSADEDDEAPIEHTIRNAEERDERIKITFNIKKAEEKEDDYGAKDKDFAEKMRKVLDRMG